MSSRCLCVSVVVTLTKPERLSGVEEVGPGIAFFLQQLRHIRDGEVGDLHALRDLLPRQRHRYRGLRFCACREDRSQTFPPRVLHPVDINLRRGALRNRSLVSAARKYATPKITMFLETLRVRFHPRLPSP